MAGRCCRAGEEAAAAAAELAAPDADMKEEAAEEEAKKKPVAIAKVREAIKKVCREGPPPSTVSPKAVMQDVERLLETSLEVRQPVSIPPASRVTRAVAIASLSLAHPDVGESTLAARSPVRRKCSRSLRRCWRL